MHLHRSLGWSLDDIDCALNRESGLRGLAGENDFGEVMTSLDTLGFGRPHGSTTERDRWSSRASAGEPVSRPGDLTRALSTRVTRGSRHGT